MKRYEKLSGAEIVALMEQCNKAHYDLADCPIGKGNLGVCPDDCLLAWLKSDVQLVPRWQTAKTQEDMDRRFDAFGAFCSHRACNGCKYNQDYNPNKSMFICYHAYLSELVDAETNG